MLNIHFPWKWFLEVFQNLRKHQICNFIFSFLACFIIKLSSWFGWAIFCPLKEGWFIKLRSKGKALCSKTGSFFLQMASSRQPATNCPLIAAFCWLSHESGEQSRTLQLLSALLAVAVPGGGPGDEAEAASSPVFVGRVATEWHGEFMDRAAGGALARLPHCLWAALFCIVAQTVS